MIKNNINVTCYFFSLFIRFSPSSGRSVFGGYRINEIFTHFFICQIILNTNWTSIQVVVEWNYNWIAVLTRVNSSTALSLSGVELNKPTHFTVSTKGAGKANLDCNFSGPAKGEAVKDFEIINNHDNTHTVKYTPVQQVEWENHADTHFDT